MCPQIMYVGKRKVTLVAFIQTIAIVCFQMGPQIACLRGCIVTLDTFVKQLCSVLPSVLH